LTDRLGPRRKILLLATPLRGVKTFDSAVFNIQAGYRSRFCSEEEEEIPASDGLFHNALLVGTRHTPRATVARTGLTAPAVRDSSIASRRISHTTPEADCELTSLLIDIEPAY
jgi:hypothetical protein